MRRELGLGVNDVILFQEKEYKVVKVDGNKVYYSEGYYTHDWLVSLVSKAGAEFEPPQNCPNCKDYIVALQTGGVMEQPSFKYINHQTIRARNKQEAENIYNARNNCSYYYGRVVGVDGSITIWDERSLGNSFC